MTDDRGSKATQILTYLDTHNHSVSGHAKLRDSTNEILAASNTITRPGSMTLHGATIALNPLLTAESN